jgi:uncharacterized repeat protein (TIGR02543 family)
VVTLTATPNAGYAFSSWTGDAQGATPQIQVTMDKAKTVTANFVAASIIVDNADGAAAVSLVSTWTVSTTTTGYLATNYLHDGNTGKGTKSVTFTPNLPATGQYQVAIRYTAGTNRATNVPVDIISAAGTSTATVNQQINGGQWNVLGTYAFNAGTTGKVQFRNAGTNGYVIADAVRFVKQ